MAFKFNGGNGAIICDVCRIITKAPAKTEDAQPNGDYCQKHCAGLRRFAVGKFTSVDKRVQIDGPVRLWIDNDDVDTDFVRELVPHIMSALNSPEMLAAIEDAEQNQQARFERNED